jgi:hypothetical protein
LILSIELELGAFSFGEMSAGQWGLPIIETLQDKGCFLFLNFFLFFLNSLDEH